MQIELSIINQENEVVMCSSGVDEAVLATKKYAFQAGDKFKVVTEEKQLVYVQLDNALGSSLVYLSKGEWVYEIPMTEKLREAYPPAAFLDEKHYFFVRKAFAEEQTSYRNWALNPHDQKDVDNVYPHAYANVETRNDATFFARNAIDGILANRDHGSYPYQSWGINQQKEAEITIDFGREIELDKLGLVLRADFPHDSYWKQVTIVFSDGSEEIFATSDALATQYFTFSPRTVTTATLKHLIKAEDESPFPALTQIELFGYQKLLN